jgi:type I restriction enzyme R subunit
LRFALAIRRYERAEHGQRSYESIGQSSAESRNVLARLREVIEGVDRWTEKEQTQAEVKSLILDHIFATLPDPYSVAEKQAAADRLYQHVWHVSASGGFMAAAGG